MAAVYFADGMNGPATFELFVRELPPHRNFLVACGLEAALEYLQSLEFSPDDLDYLKSMGMFAGDFLDFLTELSFTGDVWAIPEGEIVFAQEPLLRITAPLIEAQLVETYLLNCIGFSTSVASKAARVSLSCGGRTFVDFGARRAHAGDASLLAARAAVIGGAQATSNVLAAKLYGLEVSGTMAHSFIQAFDSERDAFLAFARQFPERSVFLIDTYDTIEGARITVSVAQELQREGVQIRAVRLDSGDLGGLAVEVRRILDEAGFDGIQIFASGDLDEYRIAELMNERAPIDAFGVGTQLVTSADAPALGVAYKLVEDQSGPKFKLSTGKRSYPFAKQVYRLEEDGKYSRDFVVPASARAEGTPLLDPVLEHGERAGKTLSITEIQDRCSKALGQLPEYLLSLEASSSAYPVELHADLTS